MTTRKMFVTLLLANLLTVAIVTAAVQTGGLVLAGPAPRSASDAERAAAFDPNLVPVVPWVMNYQGILKDDQGKPLTGKHNLTFTIYRWDQVAGQSVSVWTETHNDVDISNGLFNVALGNKGNPLHGDVFAGMGVNGTWDGALELGVAVDGGAELTPTVALGTVPYAYRAEYVNRFPAPHWNSGWYTIAQGEVKTWTHNLGGDVDDYVVDVQFKGSDGKIHNTYYGLNYDDMNGHWGAHWGNLTNSQISVTRGGDDNVVSQVRVRIWRTD